VTGCCKKNFRNIRFCRPNGRWLSLLDDFVTTNFGTRAPRARAPPGAEILATPLLLSLKYKSERITNDERGDNTNK